MLHPHEVIEYMIAGSIILIILTIAGIMYWKRKWKFGFYIAALSLIAIIFLFVIRPIWMDNQINKKIIVLEEYLQEQYADASWTIEPVDFRENKTINPYYLHVDFLDDPYHTYYYYVYRNGDVKQVGGASEDALLWEQKYYEINE